VAAPARIALVHLVRSANGPAPFEAFLDSYTQFPAGTEHDLVLLFKGFDGPAQLRPYLERAADHRPAQLEVCDAGLDLTAYVRAAAMLEHERVCFVNSFSEILVPHWLGLLDAALDDPAVGAAGATGSWASHLSYNLFQLGVPGAYARAFAGRRAAREAMHEISGTRQPQAAPYWLFTLRETLRHMRGTGRFPAVHMRTNAFLVDRERFLDLAGSQLRTKWDTYRLESGPRSITAQLCDGGTPPVVVDAHGVARTPPDWHRGDVFFQAGQAQLLVADNQTRSYASATPAQRAVLSAFAWGTRARPGRDYPPASPSPRPPA
jgi:hypothetical protein